MLEKLRERYDRIIIDAPPVMPLADARVIAALADATLLVLRADKSTRRISLAARNELWRVRATRIGVVVNGVPMRTHGYGYGYVMDTGMRVTFHTRKVATLRPKAPARSAAL